MDPNFGAIIIGSLIVVYCIGTITNGWWRKYSPKIKMHESTKSYLSNIFQRFHDGKSLKDAIRDK